MMPTNVVTDYLDFNRKCSVKSVISARNPTMDILLLAVEFMDTAKNCHDCSKEPRPVESKFHGGQACIETRKSCHSCGNVRKSFHRCQICPQVFCRNCTKKMIAMYGKTIFSSESCPVCSLTCCCAQKSFKCAKKYHCYRKCPVSRADVPRNPQAALARTAAAEPPSDESPEQKLLLGYKFDAKQRYGAGEYKHNNTVNPMAPPKTLCRPFQDVESMTSQSSQLQNTPPLSFKTRGNYQNLKLPGLVSSGLLLIGVDLSKPNLK